MYIWCYLCLLDFTCMCLYVCTCIYTNIYIYIYIYFQVLYAVLYGVNAYSVCIRIYLLAACNYHQVFVQGIWRCVTLFCWVKLFVNDWIKYMLLNVYLKKAESVNFIFISCLGEWTALTITARNRINVDAVLGCSLRRASRTMCLCVCGCAHIGIRVQCAHTFPDTDTIFTPVAIILFNQPFSYWRQYERLILWCTSTQPSVHSFKHTPARSQYAQLSSRMRAHTYNTDANNTQRCIYVSSCI